MGSVVLLSAEDDAADTILPRLKAAGGDPERVVVLSSLRSREDNSDLAFSLSRDLPLLEAEMRGRGDVRLVIFDPVTAYLGGAHANANSEVRELLAPVRALAERRGVAVVGISHLTKRSEAAVMYRAMGSLGFVAASRAVWAVGADPSEPGRMLFLPVKCNLAGGLKGLAYRIVASARNPEVPVLAWEAGAVDLTADEALASAGYRLTPRERAGMWLERLLSAGPRGAAEVARLARTAGFSLRTLTRARREVGVETFHERLDAPWTLRLPKEEAELFGGGSAEAGPAQGEPGAVPEAEAKG